MMGEILEVIYRDDGGCRDWSWAKNLKLGNGKMMTGDGKWGWQMGEYFNIGAFGKEMGLEGRSLVLLVY